MADHRLDEQPGQRRGDPEKGEILFGRAHRLEDPADIGILQRKADLNAEKAERGIP